jgi:hypothetical protein
MNFSDNIHIRLAVLIILMILLSMPSEIFAEATADLYFGTGLSQKATVSGAAPVSGDIDLQSYGYRLGFWSNKYKKIGLGIDGSYIRAEGRDVSMDILPLSFLLMARGNFRESEDFPSGRVQPYVCLGGAITVVGASVYGHNAADLKMEPDIRAGVSYLFDRYIGASIEYRRFSARAESIGTSDLGIEMEMNILQMGITFRY